MTVALVALAGGAAIGQGKITTMEEYTKLMKSNAQANGAINKAIGSGACHKTYREGDAQTGFRFKPEV